MILITIIMIWCVCIGMTVGMYFLHREINYLSQDFVSREEFDTEMKRTRHRIDERKLP